MTQYIKTKKNRVKYHFITNNDTNNTNDQPTNINDIMFFYQLSTFQNPHKKKFHLKKFIIDHNNNFIGLKEYYITLNQRNKFLNANQKNKYKMYSTYDLNNINYPTMGDILHAKSDILSTNSSYTGFAQF